MKKIFSELGFLLVYGRVHSASGDSLYQQLLVFLRLCLLAILFSIFAGVIIACFFVFFDIEKPYNIFLNLLREEAYGYQFALTCLYAPVVEEIEFRLCLKYSKVNFTAFLSIWFYYFFKKFTFENTLLGEHSYISLSIAVTIGFLAFAYSFLDKNKVVNDYLERFWFKRYKFIFYISVIGFGFIHISNFDSHFITLLLTPILTLSQTSLGLLLGFIRLKYGILYSMLLHFAFNFFIICINFLFT